MTNVHRQTNKKYIQRQLREVHSIIINTGDHSYLPE